MAHPSNSVEERLRELKEAYAKLFSGDANNQFINPSANYTKHYRQIHSNQRGKYDDKDKLVHVLDAEVEKLLFTLSTGEKKDNEESLSKAFSNNDTFRQSQSAGPTKLKLRPLLEDLNKKGVVEKRNFMMQRMDDLSLTKPARVMDYVRNKYPISRPAQSATLSQHPIIISTHDPSSEMEMRENDTNENTFFILGDVHRCIREYLTSTGWIEKFSGHEERMNLIRSLQGVQSHDRSMGRTLAQDPVKFIWVNGFLNWSLISNNVIVSRIPSSSYYFSKTALATSLRDLFPFLYKKGAVDVLTPRTYELRMPDDMKHFIKQYRINACVSLLKKFVSSEDSANKMIADDGTVPLESVDFAIQRLVEYIRFYQNADLDEWHFSVISDEDWNLFILRFQDLVIQDAKFQTINQDINVQKLKTACGKLCLMYEKYFPDTKHDGYRNLWIVKPANGSCGRGVRIFKALRDIQNYCKPTNSYVIQKYIEKPLLIHQTKFDIRQWFLITSVYPLVIWMYNECYLRFCSQQFSLVNVHESVHLCNNSVQNKYKNGSRSPCLPDDNMWDDKTFQMYLSNREHADFWPEIKRKMKEAIIASCLVSQDKMYHRTNSFHLYGADFMITPDYDVWLIEINTHPSMKYSTSVTTRMCKEVLRDTLKVGLDRRMNPYADTGKFIEIYRQASHMPTVGVPASAAGVTARKIRLVNQQGLKETTPMKIFEEMSSNKLKNVKWLSYTHLATYKKHNKVNFKYLVLRHTDMPLDPGDSIAQRDIGYAGVLDKTVQNETSSEENEGHSGSEGEKDKRKSLISRPVNQGSLHKKIIPKHKTNEYTLAWEESPEGDEGKNNNKTSGVPKKQNLNNTESETILKSGDSKEIEVPQLNPDNKSFRGKSIQNDTVQVQTVHKAEREWILKTERPDNTVISEKKSMALKKTAAFESGVNSKKVSTEETPSKDKTAKPKKNTNHNKTAIRSVNQRKDENVIHSMSSENIENKKNITNNVKNVANQGKMINKQSKGPNVTKNTLRSKKNDTNPILQAGIKKTRKSKPNSSENKEDTRKVDVSPTFEKTKNSSKISLRTNKTNSAVEKILVHNLTSESINFLKISKQHRDKNTKMNQNQNKAKLKGNNVNRGVSKKKYSNQLQKPVSSNTSISRLKSRMINKTEGTDSATRNPSMKPSLHLKMQTGRGTKTSLKSNNGGSFKQRSSKVYPINGGKKISPEAEKQDGKHQSETDNKELSSDESSSTDLNESEDGDDMDIFQKTFLPQKLIFMMSDSENSFKTAANICSNELLINERSLGSEEFSSIDFDEESDHSILSFASQEKTQSNSIKRYHDRNKYCE